MVREFVALSHCLAVALFSVSVAAPGIEASTPCAPRPVVHRAAPVSADQPTQQTFTVASLNMAGQAGIGHVLAAWARDRQIDTLLLQEVGHLSSDGGAFVAALSGRLGLHFAYAPAHLLGDTHTQGLAIVSRHPLSDLRVHPLAYHRLRFKSRCRIALAATVTTTHGPVRLVNVHLDTRINSKDRVAQLTDALEAFKYVDGPQIIGGDFNTMNIGWFRTMWPFPFLQPQSATIRALLATGGFHTPFDGGPPTFRFLGLPLRLDWLYLKEVESLDWGVDAVRFTDHRGVWARLRARASLR